jgi:hypothetical protein
MRRLAVNFHSPNVLLLPFLTLIAINGRQTPIQAKQQGVRASWRRKGDAAFNALGLGKTTSNEKGDARRRPRRPIEPLLADEVRQGKARQRRGTQK